MKRSYLSGSEKRKRRKEKETAALKNSHTLFSVGFHKVGTSSTPHSSSSTAHNLNTDDDDASSCSDDLANVGDDLKLSDKNSNSDIDSVMDLCGHGTSSSPLNNALTQASVAQHEEPDTCYTPNGCDIGKLLKTTLTDSEVKQTILSGPIHYPKSFPRDSKNVKFPVSILTSKLQNGNYVERDWLVWSEEKTALFCFPCRIFSCSEVSHLSSVTGWSTEIGWKKLYDRIPMHEKSITHRENYIRWREAELHLHDDGIDVRLSDDIRSEKLRWREILKRIIDVILFLGERGLAFRGSTQKIGHRDNGNFLGIMELLSHYDPLLREHVIKVAESQKEGKRLPVHYLSSDSQNEFISACAYHVRQTILEELMNAKYYSVIVDATPDCSHSNGGSLPTPNVWKDLTGLTIPWYWM
ncbi:PREDICTED: zinc finger MYM-type protein 1-like [Amphimedon queenslandica]|uniref:TTF-type domain-containing protein n=1 Tax=Amphimedon queenslandica TaxID=400682 RepID=A0AAN0J2S4_AMPQE|nr:PREDICTED: zinc finger MYM-type protein 1-like [Amphimedon queenslandica]|eukprot:XP_019851026.1 PREDICTED: zinc finger MYM-type protein 1-like [Amphimedon queenslandica]